SRCSVSSRHTYRRRRNSSGKNVFSIWLNCSADCGGWKNGSDVEHLVESVAALQRRLEQAGVPSIVIGGLAVSAWGEPRVTRDADLKVLLNRESGQQLLNVLGSEYVSLIAEPLQALRGSGMLF